MIAVEKVIYAALSTDGLVRSLVSARIYPEFAPQGTALPYITFQEIDGVPVRSHSGYSGSTASRVQVDVFADNMDSLGDVFRAVRLALTDRSFTHAGVVTQQISLDGYRTAPIAPFDGGERMVRRKIIDFLVPWFEEPLVYA